MQTETLDISRARDAVEIVLSRPKALNALNLELMGGLRYFFTQGYKEYEPFTAVILTGAGDKAFAAGADISEFEGLDAQQGTQFSRNGQDTFFLVERFHKPVIAAVNGFALGGGCELAMACHLRYASENAKFGQPEVNLGLIPGYGGTQRLVQYVGKSKAMELALTGDLVPAAEALRIGLINAVVPPDKLLEHCHTVIEKIDSKGPLAVQRVIRCINGYYGGLANGYHQEADAFGELFSTEDFKEGTSAFLEKRKPGFKGK
jgi:enoyl-CoA hydratase